MSIRLTCAICNKPDERLAIIIDLSEIDNWLPYTCIDCCEKGYNAKEELKAKEEVKKAQNFEESDWFKEMRENEEKEKMGLIRCPICDRFSPINETRKKDGTFIERLCDKCKPKE